MMDRRAFLATAAGGHARWRCRIPGTTGNRGIIVQRASGLPSLLVAAVLLAPMAWSAGDDASLSVLLRLFPDSKAPTSYGKKSELTVQTSLRHWARNSKWHPELDERSVFHALLQHKSVEERNWDLGIGKGGQIYSIYSSFGEAMAPQSPHSRWMDEVWQFTTIYGRRHGRGLPQKLQSQGNAFVHQSGIYTRGKDAKPFYSPILATRFDPKRRAYAVVSWGQTPTASINRSGILVYAEYRDLGAGAIEVTYVVYNFENEPMSNLSPWGGVRTSTFPEHVVSDPDGGYRFFDPFNYGQDGCRIDVEKTGGWAAAVQNADNPYSYAIGVVFGRKLDRKGQHYGKPRYDCGDSRHGTRDYSVQATVINIKDKPFTPHLLRMYFVIGTLQKVAKKANQLVDFADYEPLDLNEKDTPLVPLYAKAVRGGGPVLSKQRPGDAGARPVCRVYAYPVEGSLPLFVIKDNRSGRHFVTTDPYAGCEREVFRNPFKPGDAKYKKYQNRTIYHAYRRKTDWVELLGFVMPKDKAIRTANTAPLASIGGMSESFEPGERETADALLATRASP